MNHAVRAAGKHDVGSTVTNELGGFADGLAAGRTGRQTVVIWSLKIKIIGQMSRGRVRLLFELAPRMKLLQPARGEGDAIDLAALRLITLGHQTDQIMEVLDPLP